MNRSRSNTEPRVVVRANLQEVGREAAAHFRRLAAESIAATGRFSVALSGGSTPRALYRSLAEPPSHDAIDWTRVHLFWSDERFVPADHPDSNYRLAREAFISRAPIPAANVHPFPTDAADPQTAAAQYEDTLRRFFAAREGFDLILLGLGADGHTASLFPGSPALDPPEADRLAVAAHVPKLDAWRLTLTPPVLRAARHIVFLVAGPDKASTLREVLQGPYDPNRLPAQLARPEDGDVTWLVDEAAASLLDEALQADSP
jgi:6-phosphogluconolactonase